MMKAIETHYKGYRFRSRLEARWAVFFDTIGYEWDYEKEGYDLGEAGYYLPDFWLPIPNAWAEVKPSMAEASRDDIIKLGINLGIKAQKLTELTDSRFIYLLGIPEKKPYLFTWRGFDGKEYYPETTMAFLHEDLLTIERGVKAARSARFEHGESGA